MYKAKLLGVCAVIALLFTGVAGAQDVYNNSVRYSKGQSVQPVFEGWSKNPDGTFAMWFGYLNRNHEEKLHVGVGADNGFSGEDMGQPEFFEPRRQMFAFKIDVPANFPKDRDLVWTLKANGVTLKAFGCLWPVWEIDQNTISANRGSAPRSISTIHRMKRPSSSTHRRPNARKSASH